MGVAPYTGLPKKGVGALLSGSAFNHERAPMSCLQQLDALVENKWYNRTTSGFEVESYQHATLGMAKRYHEHGVTCSATAFATSIYTKMPVKHR